MDTLEPGITQQEFKEEGLVFLISQPRSGSTLLQTLMQTSNEIASHEETWSALILLSLMQQEIGIYADFDFSLGRKAFDNFLACKDNREVYRNGVKRLLLELYSHSKEAGKTLYLEKTPRNYFILNELYRCFPNSKYILLVRNPASVLESICRTWCTIETSEDLIRLHGFYYDLILAPRIIGSFFADRSTSQNVIRVSFDEMLRRPHLELGRIKSFLLLERDLDNRYKVVRTPQLGDGHTFPLYSGIESSMSDRWKQSSTLVKSVMWFYLKSLSEDIKNFLYSDYVLVEEYLRDFEDSAIEQQWSDLFLEPEPRLVDYRQVQRMQELIARHHRYAQELQMELEERGISVDTRW